MKRTITLIFSAFVACSAVAVASELTSTSAPTAQIFKKSKSEIKDVTFNVQLHCKNCVKKVQENIAFEKGVKDLQVSLEKQTIAIKYDASKTSEETLKNAIVKLGIPVKSVSRN